MERSRSVADRGGWSAALAAVVVAWTWAGAIGQAPPPADNVGHERHLHPHNPKHATEAPTARRFTTSRTSEIVLPLPEEKEAFTFVVYGDRTGGPVDGVKVLADAVRDTNLLEPDLVMTVGDLINGYNDTPAWMEQMREFKGIMDRLLCPWFPVAGNHDVYWRGPAGKKPAGEHEANYEMHFGPLWYAFEHKRCWFVALYSDEGNPETGEKAIDKPESQRMSEEQLAWLRSILSRAKGAEHVFVFLHHPRWLKGKYGKDWEKVHTELVAAGNVTAVFAGHIHHMRYDPRDGIEYVTLATVGGHQDGTVPGAGYLHQYHVVTVRKGQVAMAAFPVGEAIDVRELTGTLKDECVQQSRVRAAVSGPLTLSADGAVNQGLALTLPNTTSRTIEVTVSPGSGDSRWVFAPDHVHQRVEPGESATVEFRVGRAAGGVDQWLRAAEVAINTDVLMPGHRYALPEQEVNLALDIDALPAPETDGKERALRLEGDGAMVVESAEAPVPAGPFTIECWMKAERFGARTGLVCKTEQSEYGIFVSGGVPAFSVFLGRAYVEAGAERVMLHTGKWHHVAGVFDGHEVRLYVDGRLSAKAAAPEGAARRTNRLPLMVGADVTDAGSATSHFTGAIDAVHLSAGARYRGEFTPARRPAADGDTILLTNFDRLIGTQVWSDGQGGKRRLAGRLTGSCALVPVD